MKLITKAAMASAIAGLGIAAALTSAQAAPFADLDANTDGQLDLAELQTAFGESAEATLEAYDTDGDTMISVEEAEAMSAATEGTEAVEGAADAAVDAGTEAAADAGAEAAMDAGTETGMEAVIEEGTEAEAEMSN